MLKEIRIAKVATYPTELQSLNNLRNINFIFGTNGSGKTTISRILADPSAYTTCSVIWDNGRQLETLVYNSDFVRRNFTPQMRGIFTLGEVEADVLKQIEDARIKVDGIEGQIAQLEQNLGATGNSIGKYAELSELRNQFEGECWKIKNEHDSHFQRAFEGLRNSKAKFCDRILSENSTNQDLLHELDNLKERAETVFADDVARLSLLARFTSDGLLAIESSAVLTKKVVGKEDIDIGVLIRRLNNSDWVRHGLRYIAGADASCPFCQQSLDAELIAKLNAFFDETYIADITEIARLEAVYTSSANELLEIVDTALTSGSAFIDVKSLQPLVERLQAIITLNKRHFERKRQEPSSPIALEPLAEALNTIAAVIHNANRDISRHNALVDNLAAERARLTSEIWKYLVEAKKDVINPYLAAKTKLDKAIAAMTQQVEAKHASLTAARENLTLLEKNVTSVQPTVTEINAILESFGFHSFKLVSTGDKAEAYAIVRGDGSSAGQTLSEGEKSFITFLYFYHLIWGSTSSSGVNTDRVIVFDDPVSSLDSEVLFIVSALIKRALTEACKGNGRVKQVFVLTHNVYFHKEVSFDPKRQNECRAHETFWVVRKVHNAAKIQGYTNNPIKSSYQLLWDEVRAPTRSNLTIQNILRRILEHYFTILGNMDKDAVVAHFQGRDQLICSSLFSWINDGSHNFTDDLYINIDDATVHQYLAVFKDIFVKHGHSAHYKMMMGPELLETTPVVPAEIVINIAENLADNDLVTADAKFA